MAGYQTEIEIISASECDAPYERQRCFIVAYANHLALQQRKGWAGWSEIVTPSGLSPADANIEG